MDFSQLGTNGTLTAIVLAFAIIGFLKGLVRVFFMILTLLGTAASVYFTFHHGVDTLRPHWPQIPDSATSLLCVCSGMGAFLILFQFFRFLVSPFEKSRLLTRIGFGLPASFCCLLLGTLLLWFGLGQFRQRAHLAELDYLLARRHDITSEPNWIAQLHTVINQSTIGRLFKKLDPFHNQAKLNLTKLVISASNQEDYETLESNEQTSQILREPEIWQLLTSEKVHELIQNEALQELVDHPELDRILHNHSIRSQLEALHIEDQLTQ